MSYQVLKSLDFDLEDVVVNLFYINARMLNLETPTPTNITDAQVKLFLLSSKQHSTLQTIDLGFSSRLFFNFTPKERNG